MGRPDQGRGHPAGRGHHPGHPGRRPQDSWTLTDWFENVYLSQAGPENYDKLAKHEIKWTDPTVGKALQTLAEIWGKPDFLNGGVATATKTKFDESVTQVFGQEKAAMVYGGDFAAANIATTKAKVGTDAKVFAFPQAATPPRRSSAATSRSR